ncbi:MAG TPA: mannose-1-phosphate guanylyltransferase [Acidobacteriota bacterium]|nr:mannose-1-phosphate guanylyltransferase [Acidobacteriota bacterium]
MTGAEKLYAVIMAGGRGERFWPLSTPTLPKPFIPLLGSSSLLQETAARIHCLIPVDRILISIGEEHAETAARQLPHIPESNFIVEPVGRDTAACLGFCALHIEQRDPDATMLALPSDHFIGDNRAYARAIAVGLEHLEGSTGIVFGIPPTRPETGYGYILVDNRDRQPAALNVIRFVEKPDAARAANYAASGDYFWNSGMFLWKSRTLLALFEQHMPETFEGLRKLRPLIGEKGSEEKIRALFSSLPRISIDFGIMEKTEGLKLVPARFPWDDIGGWASLERVIHPDAKGNIVQGHHVAVESNNCIIYSRSGTVATFGVSDLVVVEANGNVLVCSRDRAADLKKLVAALDCKKD